VRYSRRGRMLLLPIGQENDTVRRTPWISFALIAANVLVFALATISFDQRAHVADVRQRFQDAAEYLYERPYLDAPENLTRLTTSRFDENVAQLRKGVDPRRLPSVDQRAREQAELQELADRISEALRRFPSYHLGFIPAVKHPTTVLTYMFMHAGWMHLLGNMLFLFLTGPLIEDLYGRALFGTMYLASGIEAALVFAMHAGASTSPLVGASGAIAGVMGAFLIRLGKERIRFLFIPIVLMPWHTFKIWLPAYVVLPLWLGQQFWYAHSSDQGSGVAWWAHIGGFVFGALVAGLVRLTRIEERYISAGIEREISLVQHPGLERAIDARAAGDLAAAKREIRAVLTAEPQNVDAWTEAYEIAIASGNEAEAGTQAQRLLELHLRKGEKDLARHLIEDASGRLAGTLPLRFVMGAAAFLEKDGDARGALGMYQQVLERAPQDPSAFRAAFRRGEILRQAGDVGNARAAYEQALAHPACVPPWPQTIGSTLARLAG
jgi:membrane associated rhomboid family serine protease